MDWFKMLSDYYRDLAIAMGTDEAEVMFVRGCALAADTESGGFIPDALLHHLCRRPQRATKIAAMLVSPPGDQDPLWERVAGGFQIVSWGKINAELEKYVERKRRDRDRKRAARSGGLSADMSTDRSAEKSTDSLYESESESKKKTAAAAAVGAAAAATGGDPTAVDLPVPVAILRSKLQEFTPLAALRFDNLRPDQITELERLTDLHGDAVLVEVAKRTCRAIPPVSVAAFIGTWAALPEPGQRLRVVEASCDKRGHGTEPADRCRFCAADSMAADG